VQGDGVEYGLNKATVIRQADYFVRTYPKVHLFFLPYNFKHLQNITCVKNLDEFLLVYKN